MSYIANPSEGGSGALFAATSSSVLTNSDVETSLIGSGVGNASVALTIRAKIGGTDLLQLSGVAPESVTDAFWRMSLIITCRSVGVSGSVVATTSWEYANAGAWKVVDLGPGVPVTIDTTVTQPFSVTAQWGSASSAVSITVTNFVLTSL